MRKVCLSEKNPNTILELLYHSVVVLPFRALGLRVCVWDCWSTRHLIKQKSFLLHFGRLLHWTAWVREVCISMITKPLAHGGNFFF